jgi:two-component system cell cycle response regulator DivK
MKTILIADDNLASRELLKEALESSGVRLLEASDGQEALDTIQAESPDLVLLDIQMPSLDGFAVLRAMRSWSPPSGAKVIGLTALAMESDRQRILEAGFDSYISKPISISHLRKRVEQWLYGDERTISAEA